MSAPPRSPPSLASRARQYRLMNHRLRRLALRSNASPFSPFSTAPTVRRIVPTKWFSSLFSLLRPAVAPFIHPSGRNDKIPPSHLTYHYRSDQFSLCLSTGSLLPNIVQDLSPFASPLPFLVLCFETELCTFVWKFPNSQKTMTHSTNSIMLVSYRTFPREVTNLGQTLGSGVHFHALVLRVCFSWRVTPFQRRHKI